MSSMKNAPKAARSASAHTPSRVLGSSRILALRWPVGAPSIHPLSLLAFLRATAERGQTTGGHAHSDQDRRHRRNESRATSVLVRMPCAVAVCTRRALHGRYLVGGEPAPRELKGHELRRIISAMVVVALATGATLGVTAAQPDPGQGEGQAVHGSPGRHAQLSDRREKRRAPESPVASVLGIAGGDERDVEVRPQERVGVVAAVESGGDVFTRSGSRQDDPVAIDRAF